MASYFISPVEESDWTFSAEVLRARLEDGMGATVTGPVNDADEYQLHWSINAEATAPLQGALDRGGNAIVLDGALADCAAFAEGVLDLIEGAPVEVQFYNESYTAAVPLHPRMAAAEIVTAFRANA